MRSIKIIIVAALTSLSFAAMADFEKHEPAQIDFNKMIEANHIESRKLQQELSNRGFGNRPAPQAKDSKRVTDLIDAEIGWGEAPKVVDRRFNSIAEPKVVLIPNPQS